MYKDKQIDYYGDRKRYDKMIARVGRKTGLNFNKVDDPAKAEILNFTDSGTRTIYGGKGSNPEQPDAPGWHSNLQGFGKGYEGTKYKTAIGELDADKIRGLSSAIDPRSLGHDDMTQVNRTDGSLDKKTRGAVMAHELGHSLGLRGDLSIKNPNDPSVMSYNEGKNNRLKRRDFRSIRENFKDYM